MSGQKFVLGIGHELRTVRQIRKFFKIVDWLKNNTKPGDKIALEVSRQELEELKTFGTKKERLAAYAGDRIDFGRFWKRLIGVCNDLKLEIAYVDFWPAKRRVLEKSRRIEAKRKLRKSDINTIDSFLVGPVRETRFIKRVNSSGSRVLICGGAHANYVARKLGATCLLFEPAKAAKESRDFYKQVRARKLYSQRKKRRIARQRKLGIVK